VYYRKMTGKKCYLSPIDVNDAEKFTEWLNDMELTENLTLYTQIISIEKEKEFLGVLARDYSFSIIDNESNELLGNCGFHDLDHVNQTAEIGILIRNRKYWNIGYGTEALCLLVDYGFKALNLHNISLRVFSFNERAKKCYAKTGFRVIGKKREALLRGNERHDVIFMDILRDEFYEQYNLSM